MNNKLFLYKIYGMMPIFIQDIAITAYGLLLYLKRFGKVYKRYLKIYCNKEYGDINKELAFQNEEFLKLFHYAINHSPFYKEFYKNIDISEIKSVADIVKLPILEKEVLKSNIKKVYTTSKGVKHHTGGTTGKPMTVLFRKEDVQKRQAYLDAFKYRYGFVNNKMKTARFFGKNIIPKNQKKPVFWRTNYIGKQRYYSSFYINKESLPYYVRDLNKFKPDSIDGFVSSIYQVAKYINENNFKIEFQLKAVFTTAETVLPYHRVEIEKAFNCHLIDQYASNEGAPFITQCENGNLHENIDTGVFEHIQTSEGKKLIVTSFDTYGTPLIRYDIGDVVTESDTTICGCGLSHPIIKNLSGRNTDCLLTKDGRKVSLAIISSMIAELPSSIKNIQFIQNCLETLEIKVVLEDKCDNVNSVIKNKIAEFFGDDVEFKIDVVQSIDVEKSGKFRLIKSSIV